MNPLVTVVIPTFNGVRWIDATIRSVLDQRYAPIEVIVCDDGSTDGTQELVAHRFPIVRLLCQANRGVSVARNRAVRAGSGPLLAFLDQDDLWEPDLLQAQVATLSAERDAGLVYADSWIVDARGQTHGRRGQHLRYAQGDVFCDLLRGNFIPIETMVVPRDVFLNVGGFDPAYRYLEDYDLCLRIARAHPVLFTPDALARYRVHDTNLSHDIEALLQEWVAILSAVPASFTHLSEDERALTTRERDRRRAELAWKWLVTGRAEDAEHLLRSVKHVRPWTLAAKIALARQVTRLSPRMRDWLAQQLPRRRLYGRPGTVVSSGPFAAPRRSRGLVGPS